MTRKAAAIQLGDVVKLHPHELNNLLSKVGAGLVLISAHSQVSIYIRAVFIRHQKEEKTETGRDYLNLNVIFFPFCYNGG